MFKRRFFNIYFFPAGDGGAGGAAGDGDGGDGGTTPDGSNTTGTKDPKGTPKGGDGDGGKKGSEPGFNNPIGEPDGDDGDKPPKYWSQIKKENQEKYKALQKYKTIDELAEQALKGEGAVSMPNKDSSIQEIEAFYRKLGLPASVDGYRFKLSDNPLPEDEADAKFIAEACYKNLLTVRQGQAVYAMVKALLETKKNTIQAQVDKVVNEYDNRVNEFYSAVYPDESVRNETIKRHTANMRDFLAKTGLTEAFESSGLIYNEKALYAIARYVDDYNPSSNVSFTPGSGRASAPGGQRRYSKDFYDAVNGGHE